MKVAITRQRFLKSSNAWLKATIERDPGRGIQSLKRSSFSDIKTWGFLHKGWQACFGSTPRTGQMKPGRS